MNQANQNEALYYVVVNHEDQHSVWPAHRETPAGWITQGQAQSKEDCLEYIEKNWTDITPLSVRNINTN